MEKKILEENTDSVIVEGGGGIGADTKMSYSSTVPATNYFWNAIENVVKYLEKTNREHIFP